MKWTTIEYIKEHSRIDYNDEDSLLEIYANAAEDTILNICNRTYEDIISVYGRIPAPIKQATLMLVENSFMQRSPVSMQNLYHVPYSFDLLIKPYMRLVDSNVEPVSITSIILGSDFQITLPVTLDDELTLSELTFTCAISNIDQKNKTVTKTNEQCTIDDETNEITVTLNSDELGIGQLMAKITLQIPDETYPDNVRRVVQKVNPNTQIIG